MFFPAASEMNAVSVCPASPIDLFKVAGREMTGCRGEGKEERRGRWKGKVEGRELVIIVIIGHEQPPKHLRRQERKFKIK